MSQHRQTPEVKFPVSVLGGRQFMTPGTSNGLDATRGHDRNGSDGSDVDNDLLSFEKLLLGDRKMRESQRAGSSGEPKMGKSEENFEPAANNGCNEVGSPRSGRGGSKEKPILLDAHCLEDGGTQCAEREVGGSSSVDTSDGLTFEEQNEEMKEETGSLTSPPTSAAGSEAGCPSVHEKNAHPTYDASTSNPPNSKPTTNTSHSNAPRPHYNTLLSSSVGAHKDIELAPLTCESKRSRWDDKEMEAADERGRSNVDDHKKKTPLMRSTKKRCLSGVGEEPPSKRWIKRRRFSSLFSSDEKTKTGGESNISSYAPSKPQYVSIPRPAPSRLTGLEGDTSDDGTMGFAGGRSDRRLPS